MSLQTSTSLKEIPEGYVLVSGPDKEDFLVPDFMVPALHQVFDGYRKKKVLDAIKGAGNVSYNSVYGPEPYRPRWMFNPYGPVLVQLRRPRYMSNSMGPT